MTLDVFSADVEQRDSWVLNAVDVRRDDRPHHRKLEQLLRRCLGVGAQVEHVNGTTLGRDLRDDRGAIDSGQHLQDELGGRHQRTGIAGTDTGRGVALFDQVDRDPHGRVFLAAQRIGWRLGHLDHFTGVANTQARIGAHHAGDERCQLALVTDENQLDAAVLL